MENSLNVLDVGAGDPDLVSKIMQLIWRYCEDIKVVPCPMELRDTLLSVAALTHLEAAGTDRTAIDMPAEDFAAAARERFHDVSGALPMPVFCNRTRPRLPH